MAKYEIGEKLAEGKTKRIWSTREGRVIVESKDDITAGNGKRHDVIPGKGAIANVTACNTLAFLKRRGVLSSFIAPYDETRFVALRTSMLPLEVVARSHADGSFLKRFPLVASMSRFDAPVVEFFLKTTQRKLWDYLFPCDDPLLVVEGEQLFAFDPNHPISPETCFGEVQLFSGSDRGREQRERDDVFQALRERMVHIAGCLSEAWAYVGCRFVDVKCEFGHTLLLADVVDNESSRVLDPDGNHLDKEPYRKGCSPGEIMEIFRRAKALSDRFKEIG